MKSGNPVASVVAELAEIKIPIRWELREFENAAYYFLRTTFIK